MSACVSCQSELVPGSRWCGVCHTSAVATIDGILASPARRLAAYLIDVTIPFLALMAMLGVSAAASSGSLFILLLLGYMGWALTLFARGRTPGKQVMGLTVIDERGQPATFGRMLVREWVGKLISGFVFGLGYAWLLFDRERQAWHDKLVSTYVVAQTRP